jgi:hypothetical protein
MPPFVARRRRFSRCLIHEDVIEVLVASVATAGFVGEFDLERLGAVAVGVS